MFDYRLLEALAKVVDCGGFERAARVLYITQSAVSQRLRQLEDVCGQILLTRSNPPKPTAAGRQLLKHYRQVKLLEDGLQALQNSETEAGPTTLPIGINADSLASWFIDAIRPLLQDASLLIDLRVDDQEQTHSYLRNGEVVGCISTEAKAIQGCRVAYLGSMVYRLLCTEDFAHQWFPLGLTGEAIATAPAVLFNHKDRLHQHYLQQTLGTLPETIPAHYFSAPEQFLQLIVEGCSYGMVPDWQSRDLRRAGRLIELLPEAAFPVELYWHCWNLDSPALQVFSRQLENKAQQLLQQ